MSIELRLPNITAKRPEEQLNQLHSYIYQLVQELNWALNVESVSLVDTNGESTAVKTFERVKELIMKSADIMDAYFKEYKIQTDLLYPSKTDYDAYTQAVDEELGNINTQLGSVGTRLTPLETLKAWTDTYISFTDDRMRLTGETQLDNAKFKKGNAYRTLLDMIYPVGSVFVSSANTNPSSELGGTWTSHSSDSAKSIYMWKRTG